jgi:phospholipid/cholesterol/gamma-HCH transport system substrate-binding protein
MENRAYAIYAGLFVLLLGLATIVAVVWIRGDHVERIGVDLVSHGSVPGLGIKAAVRLRGVDVGTVESIDFDPMDPRRIVVKVAVDRDAPLTRGTTARLGYQGVTGLAYVDLGDTGKDPRLLAQAPADQRVIELQPSLFEELATNGSALLAEVRETSRRVNALFDEPNRQRLQHTLESTEAAASELAARAKELQPAVAAFGPLVKHADQVAVQASGTLRRTDEAVTAATLVASDLREKLKALDTLAPAAARIESAARSFELGVIGDRLPNEPLVEEIGRVARSVDRAAGQLSDEPRSLIFGRSNARPGPGETGFDGGSR